jgi:predicted transposase/invertase (TIGR01784 family)
MANADDLHLPHDKLFSAAFSVPENAAALLQAKLPPAVAEAINWKQLTPLPGSFVDSQFQSSHTDLLFSAPIAEKEAMIYLLFEHQSTPDPHLPLRLLRYLSRIWERCIKDQPRGTPLPVILQVVLSQNAEVWNVPTKFSELLNLPTVLASELAPFIPDFEYRHLQLAQMAFETIPGTPAGILVLRVMKAERLGQLLEDPIWQEHLLNDTPAELLQMILRYMLGADIDMAGFKDKVKVISNPETRSTAMTLAQQFRQEGRQEGHQQGRQVSIIETLEVRFDLVPSGLQEAIREVNDDARLRELQRTAIRCTFLEEFAALL